MNSRHPSETDLALFAGGDCGRLGGYFLKRHVARCEDCQDAVAAFTGVRTAVRNLPEPDLHWDRLASEMRGNIRVGLAAGECIRDVAVAPTASTWKPQLAIGMAGVLLLAGAGVFLHGLLPHQDSAANAHAAVAESTGQGVEVRSDSGSMTLLNHGTSAADQAVTSQGAVRASYVDAGSVTITSVYVE